MLNKETVHHIAYLARLTLNDEEIKKMQESLNRILEYVAVLNRLENNKTELLPTELSGDNLTLRADEVLSQTEQVIEQMLEQAPDRQNNYIKVRAILS